MKRKIKRRTAIENILLGSGTLALGSSLSSCESTNSEKNIPTDIPWKAKGNIHHSACRWCYNSLPLEEFAEKGKAVGLEAIDLLKPEEWAIAAKYGLASSLGTDDFADISKGFNDPANHEKLFQPYIGLIDKAADAGVKQVIVFSGNRNQITEEAGLENCARGLDKIIKHAETKNVTVIMELLNSKVDHKDYQCDKTPWGVALVDKIGSPQFKLLYDIYHMQIMEGDVIRTIQTYHERISHYHTGGVPGRNEINESQELYYPAIMKAILATGFKGYVAQEFIPKAEDKIASLKEAIRICDV